MTTDRNTKLDNNETEELVGSIDGLLDELEARCESANIGFERETWGDQPAVRLRLPAGRETVDLVALGTPDLRALNSFQFEKYRMLGDFLGFYSHEEDFVEARLQPLPSGTPLAYPPIAVRRPFGLTEDRQQRTDSIVLTNDDSNHPITLTIGKLNRPAFSGV